MTAPVIGVLALQGDVREHLAMLTRAGARPTSVRRPRELTAIDGLVIPGGESTTMSHLLAGLDLLAPLRHLIADGLPVFGSCAGLILLARQVLAGRPDQHQLGGLDVVVRRNAFGRQADSFEADIEFVGIPGDQLHAVFIRAPWVEWVGENVEVLARHRGNSANDRPEDKIVAVRQGPVLGTAFHPELSGDDRVHRLFVSMVEARR